MFYFLTKLQKPIKFDVDPKFLEKNSISKIQEKKSNQKRKEIRQKKKFVVLAIRST